MDAVDPLSAPVLADLSSKMSSYYAREALAADYWGQAESGNSRWTFENHPFHLYLASRVRSGERVVDFGCGSAHSARNLPAGIEFIGIEGSEAQGAANRAAFPQHRFIHGDMTAEHGLARTADWAISLFAIEHCARPDLLLRRMVETCKPGGRVAVLCPNFEHGMNSLRSGLTALTRRDKLKRGRIADAMLAFAQDRWVWPRRVRDIHDGSLAFPIYLRPRCFDAPYVSDNDAIYLASQDKMARFMRELGCTIEVTSSDVDAPAEFRSAVICLIARVPDAC